MRISDWSSDVCSSDLPDTDNGHSRQSGNPGAGPSRAGYPLGGDDEVKEWSIFMKVLITEYLRINLDTEKWECRRCDHVHGNARDNYKRGMLVYDRDPREIHKPLLDPKMNEQIGRAHV